MARRFAILILLLAVAPLAGQETRDDLVRVAYAVDVSAPTGGKIRVAMTVTNNADDEVRLAIPAWAPGAYRIVRFGKDVKEVRAVDPKGGALAVTAVDEQTWKVKTGRARAFTVTYEVTVETGRMDADHCYLAGPDTYLYIADRKSAPCRVRFTLPEGWKVGTGLAREGDEFAARDYDTFVDCPTELGRFQLFEFAEDGAKYELVVHATGAVDGTKLVEMCRKIVKEQNLIFGGPPFDRYVFLFHFRGGPGGGGLEHLNSTNITMPYAAIRMDPLLAASVTSHEYFHLWNVKRIRPFELGPFDYAQPVRSKALWLCEGVTSYYGDRTLARIGIWNETRYLEHLAREIDSLQNNPDRKVTSVEKASQATWDRKDFPRVDYYNKGELLGLLMDLRIRTATKGKKSLDDVMRHLYQAYVVGPSKAGKGPIGVGFPEDGILKALNEVSGQDWKGFLARHVSGLEELPYAGLLSAAGLEFESAVSKVADLGMSLRSGMVMNVPPGGAAAAAGVRENDRITAINGTAVSRTNMFTEMNKLKAGQEVRLTLARGEETVEARFKVGERERVVSKIRRSPSATAAQKKILADWLGQKVQY